MEEHKRMDALPMDHCDAFVGPDSKVGGTDLVEHENWYLVQNLSSRCLSVCHL